MAVRGSGATTSWLVSSVCKNRTCFLSTSLEAYTRKMDIINCGFSGYNSVCAIPVFERVSVVLGVIPSHTTV